MAFDRRTCTNELFEELHLPAILKTHEDSNPIGKETIADVDRRAALIPQPYCHADYPSRVMNFYVDGRHYSVAQSVGDLRARDEIALSFEADMEIAQCEYVAELLEAAMTLMDPDPNLPLPVTWYRREGAKRRAA